MYLSVLYKPIVHSEFMCTCVSKVKYIILTLTILKMVGVHVLYDNIIIVIDTEL